MSQMLTGYRAVQEAITNRGNTLALLQSLQDCTQYSSLVDLFGGAVACVVESFQALKTAGIKPQTFNPEIDAFLNQSAALMAATLTMSLNQRLPIAGQQIAALATVVDAHKGKITFGTPKVINETPPQPLEVHVVNMPATQTETMDVRVVSMPTRVKSSEIDRDAKGNITDVVQYERDAALPPIAKPALQRNAG